VRPISRLVRTNSRRGRTGKLRGPRRTTTQPAKTYRAEGRVGERRERKAAVQIAEKGEDASFAEARIRKRRGKLRWERGDPEKKGPIGSKNGGENNVALREGGESRPAKKVQRKGASPCYREWGTL